MTQIHNSVAENVLGTIGAILWSLQLVPQIIKSYRDGKTEGLSPALLLIWFASGIFLGAYVLVQDLAVPLLVQPQLFSFFTAVAWGQTLYYDKGCSKRLASLLGTLICLVGGGLEVLFYFLPRIVHNDRPTTAWGVLSAVSIVIGLLPQYILIFRMGYVTGLSYLFLCVDMGGGVFSTLALAFSEGDFDILASVSYICVVVLELGIFVLAAILNPRHRRKQLLAETDRPGSKNPIPRQDTDGTEATETTLTGDELHVDGRLTDGRGRDVVQKREATKAGKGHVASGGLV